jgi:hypothetical protein
MFAPQGAQSQLLHQESMQSQMHAAEEGVYAQRGGQQMTFQQFGHSQYTSGANSGVNSQMLAQQNAHPQMLSWSGGFQMGKSAMY